MNMLFAMLWAWAAVSVLAVLGAIVIVLAEMRIDVAQAEAERSKGMLAGADPELHSRVDPPRAHVSGAQAPELK